jgi:Xaa-Pro aminopeptidase
VSRAERLAALVAERDLQAVLVLAPVNLRYVTGFTGTNGAAVVGPDLRAFMTDFRYVERAEDEVDPSFDRRRAPQDLLDGLPEVLPDGPLRLGFDDVHTSVRTHARLQEKLGDEVELVAAGGLVEELRARKDAAERERIAAAAALADDAMRALLQEGVVGRSEREVAWALERAMRERGAEQAAFPSIVAAAGNGSRPHAEPGDAPVPPGALLTVDWGARLDGYCSDCTRTFATGQLDGEQQEAYELVRRAQAAALDAVRPGPEGREVDAVARDLIEQAGHGEHFGHGLGHGVGLEVHEAPRLTRSAEGRLAPGHVVTVEPGVYVPGRFGVRIEDLVVVTDAGRDVLSSLPKELLTVG